MDSRHLSLRQLEVFVATARAGSTRAGADRVARSQSAASAALAVIYPHMTGLGWDAFWLIYDAGQHSVRYLDGAGCAAASASIFDWNINSNRREWVLKP